MDEEISKWILEFLLRQPIDERIINGVLSSLPLKDDDNRLKKTLLLRKIEFDVSNAAISEKLLDLLEIIEELDHREGKSASDSMKAAYCAVAVDCTVRFLDDNVERNGKYFEAVKRVWRERVCKIEGLASDESKQKMVEIEAALWDSNACGKLLRMNTRSEALKLVRGYLAEEWRSMGPTFLELVAEKAGNVLEGLRSDGGVGGEAVGSANLGRESAAVGETRKGQAAVRRKHIAVKSKRGRGAKISAVDEGNGDELMGKADSIPAPEVDGVPAPIESSSLEPQASKKVDWPGAQTAQTSSKGMDDMNRKTLVENQTCPKMHATPEVERVQEALKSSSMELQAAVRDPLPDALQTAQALCSTVATNNRSSKSPVVNQPGLETHTPPRACTDNDKENAEKKENPAQDLQGNEAHQGMTLRNTRHTLMEQDGTAQTFQWSDSIDDLPGGTPKRPRLPSPKEDKPSPVKYYADTKIIRRRVRKKWTPEEEDALRTGVQKFGKGNWKLILHSYREIFRERTDVDLKDKWRNMTR